METKKRRRA